MNLRELILQEIDARVARAEDVTVTGTLDLAAAEVTGYVTGLFGTASNPLVDAEPVTLTSSADPAAEVFVHEESGLSFPRVYLVDSSDGSDLDVFSVPEHRSDGTYWVASWGGPGGMADPGSDIEAELTIVKAL